MENSHSDNHSPFSFLHSPSFMDLGSIFLILAVVVLVGLYIARPLLSGSSVAVSALDQKTSALLAERDRVLDALQELDSDHQLGKIPEEDYPHQRNMLLTQGAEFLRQLDEISPRQKSTKGSDLIEAAIKARKVDQANGNGEKRRTGAPDDELETLIAARKRDLKETTGGFCPQCGHSLKMSDKFCSKCGANIH